MGGLVFCLIHERMIVYRGTTGAISSNRSYFIDHEGSVSCRRPCGATETAAMKMVEISTFQFNL
tara:strand:- start:395 stop:586 length:192 start_codon:yes stop_codon:yes gene_type:complete